MEKMVTKILARAKVYRDAPFVNTNMSSINEGIAYGLKEAAQMICPHGSTKESVSPDGEESVTVCTLCHKSIF